ncbi:MAG: tetratricopeptide repeat protein [Elusimicrobiales bacterium]|nr:tetratricopeptide repeat protein [Elusimicrobiales bacterium]
MRPFNNVKINGVKLYCSDKSGILAATAAAALAFVAMQPVLHAGFINWDESIYVLGNPLIRDFSFHGAARIFSSLHYGLYKPLTMLSFALDYKLFGLNPCGYHAVNLLFHVANTLLVLRLFRVLLGETAPAFLVAALFAAHPMHVESVAWVVERKDMLYSFFFLLSAIFYLDWKGKSGSWRLAASVAMFALSLMSKPMGVTLPAVLLLFDWLRGGRLTAALFREKLPYFALSAAALFVSLSSGGTAGAPPSGGLALRVLAPLYNLLFYAGKLIFPARLSAVYNTPAGGWQGLAFYSALCCCAVVLAVVKFRRDRLMMAGLVFYAVTLLPVLQIVPFGPVIAADRYTYIPSLGLFIVVAQGWRLWSEKFADKPQPRRFAAAFLCALLLVFTALSRARARVWENSFTLWTDTVRKQPNPMAYSALANAWLAAGRPDIASRYFAEALKLNPAHLASLVGLANAKSAAGDLAGALAGYEAAVRLYPGHAYPHANIASIAFLKGDTARAVAEMKKALELAPDSPPLLNAIAGYYTAGGDYRNARAALIRSYEIVPERQTAARLCALYCGAGDCASGLKYCRPKN